MASPLSFRPRDVMRKVTYPANQQLPTHCLKLLAGRCLRRSQILPDNRQRLDRTSRSRLFG